MLDLSPEKVVVILVIALVVLGPGRLSESARALGRARATLRQWSAGLSPDTAKLIRNPRGALFDVLAEPRQVIENTAEAARQSLVPTTPVPTTPVATTAVPTTPVPTADEPAEELR